MNVCQYVLVCLRMRVDVRGCAVKLECQQISLSSVKGCRSV